MKGNKEMQTHTAVLGAGSERLKELTMTYPFHLETAHRRYAGAWRPYRVAALVHGTRTSRWYLS